MNEAQVTNFYVSCRKCGGQVFQIVSDGRHEKTYCAMCGTAKGGER